MSKPLTAKERIDRYHNLSSHLPVCEGLRVWTDEEIEVLRAAHKVRFNEDCRSETLLTTAMAAIRIYRDRSEKDWKGHSWKYVVTPNDTKEPA